MTEWIVLSVPFVSREIEDDVKSGNLAYLLGRPVSYFWSKYSSAATHFTRMIFLSIAGFSFAYLFSGGLHLIRWALSLYSSCHIGIISFDYFLLCCRHHRFLDARFISRLFNLAKTYLCSGWNDDTLDLYPDWMKALAAWTPFPIMLYEPTKMAITMDFSGVGFAVVGLSFGSFLPSFCRVCFRRACRGLNVNGDK